MMHQARPFPPHLAGNENIRFSINQILSPGSNAPPVDDESTHYPFVPHFYGGKSGTTTEKTGNYLVQDYFYPKLENYYGEKWNGGFSYDGENRSSNSALCHQSYEPAISQCPDEQVEVRELERDVGGGSKEDANEEANPVLNSKQPGDFEARKVSPQITRAHHTMASPQSMRKHLNDAYQDYDANNLSQTRNWSSGEHFSLSNNSDLSYSKNSDYSSVFSGSKCCRSFTGYTPSVSFFTHGTRNASIEESSQSTFFKFFFPFHIGPRTDVNGGRKRFVSHREVFPFFSNVVRKLPMDGEPKRENCL